jgi:putative ABC transport system permease protein
MIRARIFSIDGRVIDRNAEDLPEDLGREFNISYRDYLEKEEQISKGEFWGASYSDKFQVSVDEERALIYDIDINSKVVFDIQGVKVDTYVSNLRKVEKNDGMPFFYFLFTKELGKDAPNSNFAFIYRDEAENYQIKKDLIDEFPNLSIVEGKKVKDNILEITSQASLVILSLMFSILILGLFIMFNLFLTLVGTKERRNVLLSILGMKNRNIKILSTIDLSISILVSLVISFIISVILTYILLIYYFETTSLIIPISMIYLYGAIFIITVISSFIAVRNVTSNKLSDAIKLLSS